MNLSGDGLEKVPVGQQATFFIEGQFDMGDPEVKILAPNKRVLSSSIRYAISHEVDPGSSLMLH